jgi:hypothetical protein
MSKKNKDKKDSPRNDPPKKDPPKKDPPKADVKTFQNIVNAVSQKSQPASPTIRLGGEKVNVNNIGKKLNPDELKKLEKKTGLTPESIITKLKDRTDVNIGSGSKKYARSWQPPGTNPPPPSEDDRDKTINDLSAQINDLTNKVTAFDNLGTLTESVTQIGADADRDVAQAYADAQTYGYGKEAEWRKDVANIEVTGKLNLQPIINAGLARVAEIEGQASRDVAETTGKYGLQSMQTRSEADKTIGKMQLAGGMYGLLGAAFG